MTFTRAPACKCRDPITFGHTACPLGPPWVIEAERRLAAMIAEQEARRRWWHKVAAGWPCDFYGNPLD